MHILHKLLAVILVFISFSSFAAKPEINNSWFLDAHLMTNQFSGTNYLLAGITIAHRFAPQWFVGATSSVNTTEKNNMNRDDNIYPIAQLGIVAGYSNRIYKNISYQVSVGRGGGIGEFTETGGDTIIQLAFVSVHTMLFRL